TFQHIDWVDGVSVVQAETTSGEDGFNVRFHRIEHDLDAIGTELAKVLQCLGDLRRAVKVALDEVATVLNRTNSGGFRCCIQEDKQVSTKIRPEVPQYRGRTTYFGKPVDVWQTTAGQIVLPPIIGPFPDPAENQRVQRIGEWAELAISPEIVSRFEKSKEG